MKLETIEFIDDRLNKIRSIILEEDSFYVNDTIINNLTDPDLDQLVMDMMVANNYSEAKMQEVLDVINEIQAKVLTDEE